MIFWRACLAYHNQLEGYNLIMVVWFTSLGALKNKVAKSDSKTIFCLIQSNSSSWNTLYYQFKFFKNIKHEWVIVMSTYLKNKKERSYEWRHVVVLSLLQDKVSISSTFFMCIFCMKFWRQKLQSQTRKKVFNLLSYKKTLV